jgi:hypothetical protein
MAIRALALLLLFASPALAAEEMTAAQREARVEACWKLFEDRYAGRTDARSPEEVELRNWCIENL